MRSVWHSMQDQRNLASLSIHKLALGTLALQDALSRGFPVQIDVDLLRASLADIKDGILVNLVLSSIPEETLNNGADTTLQLNQKFDALKGVDCGIFPSSHLTVVAYLLIAWLLLLLM